MKTCGMTINKYTLFMFNLLFTISGIAIITAGGMVLVKIREFDHFVDFRILAPPIVLIIAGTIIFVVAFLGCFGAIKESYTMLMAYAVAMLLIFVIEIAVGIAAAVLKNDFERVLKGAMTDSLMNNTRADVVAWDTVQLKFQCCGVESSDDWGKVLTSNWTQAGVYPPSCCKYADYKDPCRPYGTSNISQLGCFKALQKRVHESTNILIAAATGIGLVKIVGIVLACCLAMAIKREAAENK